MSGTQKPRCVDLDGDVLMFRVLEDGKFMDRIYVRDPLLGKEFNVWMQVPSYRLYALAFDREAYEKNWPHSEDITRVFKEKKE